MGLKRRAKPINRLSFPLSATITGVAKKRRTRHRTPGFVSGHDLSRAVKAANDDGFTGCGNAKFFEGDGLQAVRK
jgi:hypothetical protein